MPQKTIMPVVTPYPTGNVGAWLSKYIFEPTDQAQVQEISKTVVLVFGG
jgi:hypothetical protein